jgi:hypothetical protein
VTDDLVKRLLQLGEGAYVGAVSDDRKTAREAADRIEKLEAALRGIIDNFFDGARICEIAQSALEDKDV